MVSSLKAAELKYRYDEIIGRSPPMLELLKLLDRVIDSEVPVFLFGESGTGKELIARAIHFNGPRAANPFVPLNCSAIPETLLEAELFGYMRGAFTGAERNHEGVFAVANGGTLFLDEVGDMPPAMQVKLLRVLEDRVFKPLGSQKKVQANARILTASHQDLRELVKRKKFRADLFFRIHGIQITLPSLREREGDLSLLTEYFLEKFAQKQGVGKKKFSAEAWNLLAAYSWPGNIRELENTIENACLLSNGPEIGRKDLRQKKELFLGATLQASEERSFDALVLEFEKAVLWGALSEYGGNLHKTAQKLKISRPRLYRLLKKLAIPLENFR